MAEEVGYKRRTTWEPGVHRGTRVADASRAVGERLLALVEPYPGAQRLVRRAWRSAQRLGTDVDLLWSAGRPEQRGSGWLLGHVRAEVLILRPARDDPRRIEAAGLRGHF